MHVTCSPCLQSVPSVPLWWRRCSNCLTSNMVAAVARRRWRSVSLWSVVTWPIDYTIDTVAPSGGRASSHWRAAYRLTTDVASDALALVSIRLLSWWWRTTADRKPINTVAGGRASHSGCCVGSRFAGQSTAWVNSWDDVNWLWTEHRERERKTRRRWWRRRDVWMWTRNRTNAVSLIAANSQINSSQWQKLQTNERTNERTICLSLVSHATRIKRTTGVLRARALPLRVSKLRAPVLMNFYPIIANARSVKACCLLLALQICAEHWRVVITSRLLISTSERASVSAGR